MGFVGGPPRNHLLFLINICLRVRGSSPTIKEGFVGGARALPDGRATAPGSLAAELRGQPNTVSFDSKETVEQKEG